MAWVAVATIAVGAYSAHQSSQAAKAQSKAASKAADGTNYLAYTQADLAAEQYANYQDMYLPLERQLTQEAQQGLDADRYIGLATTDVSRGFDAQRQAQRRQMESFGLSPASGMRQGADRQMGIAEALGRGHAANTTRMAVDDANWSRKTQVANMGRNLPNQASAGMASAAAGLGSSAAMYGNMARQSGNDAGQWAQFGLNVADKAGWFGGSN